MIDHNADDYPASPPLDEFYRLGLMMTIKQRFAPLLLLLASSVVSLDAASDVMQLSPQHPQSYVVQKGDTLWDISARFLKNPWQWPAVWENNPRIANPNLIYPGDVIELVMTADGPRLRLRRGDGTVKLSPRIRSQALREAIPTIPLTAIHQFLADITVWSSPRGEGNGHVIEGADDHVITGGGDLIYVAALPREQGDRYAIYRPGEIYRDPDSNDVLGYAALRVGTGQYLDGDDPATLKLAASNREVLPGDLVAPVSGEAPVAVFTPVPASADQKAQIIGVVDGVSQIGQHQIVVLNKGLSDGVDTGHVFGAYQSPDATRDPVTGAVVALPRLRAGTVMVFRAFDRVSFALVMSATRAIRLYDHLGAP